MFQKRISVPMFTVAVSLCALNCSSDSDSNDSSPQGATTGGSGSGGATGTGTPAETGGLGQTGDPSALVTGGNLGSGGFVATGGLTSGSGMSTGGTTSTGPTATTGGVPATGGIGAGGTTATGGSANTGGIVAIGGRSSTGGGPSTGGGAGTGGRGGLGTGGVTATGGRSSISDGGANASGGVGQTGGSEAVGGVGGIGEGETAGFPSTGGGTNTGGTSQVGEPTFHVFLLLGQSNMAGYPKADDADKVEDERVKVLGFDDCADTGRKKDEWDIAAPPLHDCWNGALGPGDHFAKTLIDTIPEGDTIGLVPCAISGEKIETFMKNGGSKYDWIVSRARLAQDAGGVIEGMLFHQGESNNGDSSWPGKVNTLVQDLRTDLGLGSAPFLAGELPYGGGCAGHNTLVNQLPSVVDNAYVVSAEGLVVDPADTQWNLHFDHDSLVTFGQRYAQTMMDALGW